MLDNAAMSLGWFCLRSSLRQAIYGFSLCLILTSANTALADANSQVQAVRAAVNDLYRALNQNDAKAFSKHLNPNGFTEFNPDWQGTKRLDMAVFQNIFDAGAKIDLHVDEMQVQLIGSTAVVTGYRVGSITPPGGSELHSRLALTMIWADTDGRWQLQHVHLSEEMKR
jgi:uncharacterized protein (TIGR02246 family)